MVTATVTHQYVSPVADAHNPNEVGPDEWNAGHVLTNVAVDPVIATGTVTSRYLADRFADVVSVKDFGAAGDGVMVDDAAFTNVNGAGRTLRISYTTNGYAFSGSVSNTDRGFLPEPTLTWDKITDGGKFDWSRGFETNVSASNNGSAIWRFCDRVFVGAAASQFAGTPLANPDAGTNWLCDPANGPSYLPINGQLNVITNTGKYAIVAASRNSDNIAGGGTQAIGVGSAVKNDLLTGNAWGYIAELQHEVGANLTLGIEIAGKNKSGVDGITNPYLMQGGVHGVWVVAGGDASFGGAPTNPSNAAMVVLKGAQTWNTGIIFMADSITGNDGSAGSGTDAPAIRMARRHTVQWDEPTNNNWGARIVSAVTTDAAQMQQVFSDNTLQFVGVNLKNTLVLSHGANAVNYVAIFSLPTLTAPQIRAIGDDADVDLALLPQAAGTIHLRGGDDSIKIGVNSTGIGFFATAPIAKETVTGAKGGNAALGSLLTALSNYGFITDSSSA